MCILLPFQEKNWAGWDDLGACMLLRYRIKRCVADVVAGSKIATNHLLQQCVAVADLFF